MDPLIASLKLVQIKLSKIIIKGNKKNEKCCKIIRHSYYQSLNKKDPVMYETYISNSKYQSKKESSTWSHFFSLYKTIKKNGFDFTKDPIAIKNKKSKWICIHGRHRMCMMYKIYGKNSLVELDETGKMIGITIIAQ
jgi:hypothetical protein